MKNIKVTSEELELIKNALYFIYDKQLDMLKQNRSALSDEAAKSELDSANVYINILNEFERQH